MLVLPNLPVKNSGPSPVVLRQSTGAATTGISTGPWATIKVISVGSKAGGSSLLGTPDIGTTLSNSVITYRTSLFTYPFEFTGGSSGATLPRHRCICSRDVTKLFYRLLYCSSILGRWPCGGMIYHVYCKSDGIGWWIGVKVCG